MNSYLGNNERKNDVPAACPQPVCNSCVHMRQWAKPSVYVSAKGGYERKKHPCDIYPEESPTECWDIDDWLAPEDYVKICPHFKRGAVQWEEPGGRP